MVKRARPFNPAVTRPKGVKKRRMTGMSAQARNIGAAAKPTPEQKNLDVAVSLTSGAGATWSSLLLLNDIPNGNTSITRVGRKVMLTKSLLRCHTSGGAGAPANACRILMVYDRNPNGSTPAITDILQSNDIHAHVNLNTSDRFLVVMDYLPSQEQGNDPISTINGGVGFMQKITRKFFEPLLSQYTITAGIAGLQTGALWLMFSSISGADVLTGTNRIRFIDN